MKTFDATDEKITLEKLLKIAAKGPVRILTADGQPFVLESAEDFDKEVELLGKSKKFQRFIKARAKEPATRSLADYRRSLN